MKNKKITILLIFVSTIFIQVLNANPTKNGNNAKSFEKVYKPGNCDSLFSEDKIVEMQYRYSPSEKITRTIDLISAPGSRVGIFIGRDNVGWIYEGSYSGDEFSFTMKKGGDRLFGSAICTKYGAIGVKEYVNRKSETYRIMWLKKTDLTDS